MKAFWAKPYIAFLEVSQLLMNELKEHLEKARARIQKVTGVPSEPSPNAVETASVPSTPTSASTGEAMWPKPICGWSILDLIYRYQK